MFDKRVFEPKYLLGWYPASLVLSMFVGSGQGLGFILFYAFGVCLVGLFFLGLSYLFLKFKGKTPVQLEIVWWCYPPISMFAFLWGLIRAFARF